MKRLGLLAILLAACGGGDSPAKPDGPASDGPAADSPQDPDGPAAAFAITSTAFAEGQPIPDTHGCDQDNNSPQLDWVNPPANTQSFAIVFTDKTNGLIHSIIFDIPANLTGLPADVDNAFEPPDVPGAKQTASYQAQLRGYNGPCPGPADPAHTYEFALYALDVAVLPNLGMQTSRAQAKTAIEAHDLAQTTLTGTFER
jgi:Raf kinase inhibitor-like YbhB/YbcL family protein